LRTRGDVIPASATIDRSFTPEAAAEMASVPWYASFRLWATLLAVIVVGLYALFF